MPHEEERRERCRQERRQQCRESLTRKTLPEIMGIIQSLEEAGDDPAQLSREYALDVAHELYRRARTYDSWIKDYEARHAVSALRGFSAWDNFFADLHFALWRGAREPRGGE